MKSHAAEDHNMLCRYRGFLSPVPLHLNWSFLTCGTVLDFVVILVQDVCVHTYIVAGFWTLCQLWVLELSWEEFSTLVTGLHDPATCSWSNCLLDVVPVPRSATKMCLGECSATKTSSHAQLPGQG